MVCLGSGSLPPMFKIFSKSSLFLHFRPTPNVNISSTNMTINGMSIDGVLGIQTLDRWKVDANESTELYQSIECLQCYISLFSQQLGFLDSLCTLTQNDFKTFLILSIDGKHLPVWPDLAKFHLFGKIHAGFFCNFSSYLVVGKIWI